jgi:A/G-specific adenine glycosylase
MQESGRSSLSAIAKDHQNKPTHKQAVQPLKCLPVVSPARKWAEFRKRLLDWFDVAQRDLPWRHTNDAYAIWVSEIMLQQTRVAAVIERYQAFMARFPTLVDLARAPEQQVLAAWSGLGYYRRARMLHRAAQVVAHEMRGAMPANATDLRKLPGIGAYTAAAIASIAHGEPVAVVDGNVERVVCRLEGRDFGAEGGDTKLRRTIEVVAGQMLDPARPGDFNQAIMELGATLCTPRGPQCLVCPVEIHCKTRGEHKTVPRAPMVSRDAACALVVRDVAAGGSQVLLEQRAPSQTVMPGLWELPALRETAVPEQDLRMTVRHAIMQVNYAVRVRTVLEDEVDALALVGGERRWVPLTEASGMALTGLARKVLSRARLLGARNATD